MSLSPDLFPDLPKLIPGKQIDKLSGGVFCWGTIKNLRSQKKIPESCFVKVSPRKIFILRDAFLDWADLYGQKKVNQYK